MITITNNIFRRCWTNIPSTDLFTEIEGRRFKNIFKLLKNGANPNEERTIKLLNKKEDYIRNYSNHLHCENESYKNGYEITALYYALWFKSDLSIINLLIKYKGDISYRNKRSETLLHVAVIQNKIEIVQFLLNRGANVNYSCNQKHTPLQMAVNFGYKDIVEILLQHNANIDTKCDSGISPLVNAILNGDLKMVQLLLKYNPDLDLDCNFWFPLHYAVDGGNENIVEALLQKGAYVNCVTFDDFHLTPLLLAAADDNIKIIKSLVSKGANINAPNSSGFTSLFLAKSEEAVSFLLEHGANINYNDNDQKCTPLHYAVHRMDIRKSAVLLKHDANMNMLDIADCSPLSIAASLENEDLVNLLLVNNPNIIFEKEYQSPLHFAANNGNLNILNMLLEHYSNISIDNLQDQGFTPLIFAIRNEHIHIVKRLIEFGLDINLKTTVEYIITYPLREAVRVKNTKLINLILQYGADVNLECNNSYLLHFAIHLGSAEILKLLLEYGANVNVICPDGTPLHLAIQYNLFECVDLLLVYGADINIDKPPNNICTLSLAILHLHENDLVQDALLFHVIKLKSLNKFVSEQNLFWFEMELRNRCSSYDLEIEKFKNEIIFSRRNVTVYDMLTNTLYKLSAYIRNNECIDELERNLYKLDKTFPTRHLFLRHRLRKYREAINICDKSHQLLRKVLRSNVQQQFLPIEVTSHILQFFKEIEMKIFLNSFSVK